MIKITTISGVEFPDKVIPLIDAATKSIDIVIFYWRFVANEPGSRLGLFNAAIYRAVKRGVKVRAAVTSDDIRKIATAWGIECRKIETRKLMHVKMMIIDDKTVITGSHNYTKSAFELNVELSAVIESDEGVEDFNKFFENVFNLPQ